MSRSKVPASYADTAAGTFLFAGLSRERIGELLSFPGVRVDHFAAGGEIRSREKPVRELGIILYGSAKVDKSGVSGRMPMSVLRAGDLFGAAALFSGEPEYVATIRAEKSVWVLSITEEALSGMMRGEDVVMRNYLRYLTSRIRFLSERIDTFAEWDTEERLMRVLQRGSDGGVYRVGASMKSLAESISVSRATLYRTLDGLGTKGWIRRTGKTIEIIKEETI